MSLKHLFPSYRTRYLYVRDTAARLLPERVDRLLNVGCGEGEFDRMLSGYAERMLSCDIHEGDVATASELNADVAGLEYRVLDAMDLDLEPDSFDVVTCIDVIEHVPDAERVIQEVHRVLRPGGVAIVSAPSHDFPWSYDPVNRVLRAVGLRMPFGAYGYGHTVLIQVEDLLGMAERAGFVVEEESRLSGALASVVELYWVSVLQRLLKSNAANQPGSERGAVRPGREEPWGVGLTDRLIALDDRWFKGRRSIGLAVVLRKPG